MRVAFVSLAAVANRAKPLQRTMPSWHIEVQCGGGGRLAHGPLANVRTPVGPTGAAQQLFRLARSSPNLCARPSLTRSNRRGTDPYARWCGRGDAARHPPIPISGGPLPFPRDAGRQVSCPNLPSAPPGLAIMGVDHAAPAPNASDSVDSDFYTIVLSRCGDRLLRRRSLLWSG